MNPLSVPTIAKVRQDAFSLAELEQHINDCEELWWTAYERFRQYGNPHDRDEALRWLHEQNEGLRERSRRVGAARHEAFERRLDEGVDYLQSEHALALGRQHVGGLA
jgi:hypothetical protein